MTEISSSSGISLAAKALDPSALKQAAKQFEAVFLRQMISSMRSAGLGDELFGSSASEQFRDMSDARLADNMAEKGFGIGDLLLRQFMTRAQPAATTPVDGAAPATAGTPQSEGSSE